MPDDLLPPVDTESWKSYQDDLFQKQTGADLESIAAAQKAKADADAAFQQQAMADIDSIGKAQAVRQSSDEAFQRQAAADIASITQPPPAALKTGISSNSAGPIAQKALGGAAPPAAGDVAGWRSWLLSRPEIPDDLKNDPSFINTVLAGGQAESGLDHRRVQQGGGGRGLFQFDVQGGMGTGLPDEQLYDPAYQASKIIPLYVQAYRNAPADLSPAEKASWVAAQAERPYDYENPDSTARRNYAAAYQNVASSAAGGPGAVAQPAAPPEQSYGGTPIVDQPTDIPAEQGYGGSPLEAPTQIGEPPRPEDQRDAPDPPSLRPPPLLVPSPFGAVASPLGPPIQRPKYGPPDYQAAETTAETGAPIRSGEDIVGTGARQAVDVLSQPVDTSSVGGFLGSLAKAIPALLGGLVQNGKAGQFVSNQGSTLPGAMVDLVSPEHDAEEAVRRAEQRGGPGSIGVDVLGGVARAAGEAGGDAEFGARMEAGRLEAARRRARGEAPSSARPRSEDPTSMRDYEAWLLEKHKADRAQFAGMGDDELDALATATERQVAEAQRDVAAGDHSAQAFLDDATNDLRTIGLEQLSRQQEAAGALRGGIAEGRGARVAAGDVPTEGRPPPITLPVTSEPQPASTVRDRVMARMAGTAGQAAELRPTREDFAANINLSKFPEEVRPLLERGAVALNDFAGQRRGVVTDAEALAAGTEKALGTPVETWLRTQPGKAFTQEEAIALGQALTDTGREYNALRSRLADAIDQGTNTPLMEAQVAQKALEFAALEGVRSGAAAEAGRSLRAFRQVLDGAGGRSEEGLRRALKIVGGGDRFRQFVEEYGRIPPDDTRAQYQLLQGLYKPSLWDRLQTLRYAGMLSSTSTHLTNSIANTVGVGSEIAMKPLAGGLDALVSKIGGGERTRFVAETVPQIKGAAVGFWTGLGEAGQILRTGIRTSDLSKMDVRPGFQSGSRAVDTAVELPLRALTAADAVFRGAAEGGHFYALATRQAIKEGLSGEERAARVAQIVANPADHPLLLTEAQKLSARPVVQEDRGEIAPLMQLKRNDVRYLVDWFLPFVRTPYNIAAQGIGMTPAGLVGVVKAARDGRRGEAVDRTARMMVGTAAMGVGGWLAANGLMTGARPASESEASTLPQGWQPWSVRIPRADGDVYVEFRNLGPIAVPLAISAVLGDAYARGEKVDDPGKLATNAAKAVGSFMTDQTFLQGLQNVERAISDPGRYAENVLEGAASSLVPYSALQRQIQRALGMAQRDPHGAIEALLATTPFTAGQVGERLTDLGDPVVSAQRGAWAFVAPARFDVAQDEPALAALRAAGEGVPRPPKELQGYKLSSEDQDAYQQRLGVLLRQKLGRVSEGTAARNPAMVKRLKEEALNQAHQETLGRLRRTQPRPLTGKAAIGRR